MSYNYYMGKETPPNQPRYEVPPDEYDRIKFETALERVWGEALPSAQTDDDLHAWCESGEVVEVPVVGEGYQVSPGVPEQFRLLRPRAREILGIVATEWRRRCRERGLDEDVYLRITSLARTVSYEQALRSQGYPVVGEGLHTKLLAFDILVAWLQSHASAELSILTRILLDLHNEGSINLVYEPSVGVYHVGVKP